MLSPANDFSRSRAAKITEIISNSHLQTWRTERQRTAIVRKTFSRPVRLALEARLFETATTFFDYGCGHGIDADLLAARGYYSSGWDPYYFPNNTIEAADIVNLGYVINVIECPQERREALLSAWSLTKKMLIVAARTLPVEKGKGDTPYNDGIITSRRTFQRYYGQRELKEYIDSVLSADALPVAQGVCFVFRDESHSPHLLRGEFQYAAKRSNKH